MLQIMKTKCGSIRIGVVTSSQETGSLRTTSFTCGDSHATVNSAERTMAHAARALILKDLQFPREIPCGCVVKHTELHYLEAGVRVGPQVKRALTHQDGSATVLGEPENA